MSNTDSFIEEVTEEVRRDKLFATLKKWGWVGALAVVVIVGGATWNEWRKAQAASSAQAFGDQLLERFDTEFSGELLDGVSVGSPAQSAIAGHFAAAKAFAAGETEAGLQELNDISGTADIEGIYKELATFKAALAIPADSEINERIAALDGVSGIFRILAQEQKALVLIEDGQDGAAVELLRSLLLSAEATPGLQRRASELILALGADIGDSADNETINDG